MNPMNTKKFLSHPRISPMDADSSKSIPLRVISRNSRIKPQPAKSKSEQLMKQWLRGQRSLHFSLIRSHQDCPSLFDFSVAARTVFVVE
jgi:hypothetical protein